MASLVITIDTDGPAFHVCSPKCKARQLEISRILGDLASRISTVGLIADDHLIDIDGKVCGKVEVIE